MLSVTCHRLPATCDLLLAQVESLLGSRANIEAANADGWTALHWACSCGAEAVARRLLLAGAMVVALTEDGSSALSLAQDGGHEKLCQLLDVGYVATPPVSPEARGAAAPAAESADVKIEIG